MPSSVEYGKIVSPRRLSVMYLLSELMLAHPGSDILWCPGTDNV